MRTIHIQAAAPSKPRPGNPCNGCGVCCLAEPCPVGMVISRRRQGACEALRWVESAGQYRCGVLVEPYVVAMRTLPGPLACLGKPWGWVLRWMGARWISAGTGCDSTLEVQVQSGTIQTPFQPPDIP